MPPRERDHHEARCHQQPGAIAVEAFFHLGEPLGGDADAGAVMDHQRVPAVAADREADDVADRGGGPGERQQPGDVEHAAVGEQRGGDEQGLARQRQPGILEQHPGRNREIAVFVEIGLNRAEAAQIAGTSSAVIDGAAVTCCLQSP